MIVRSVLPLVLEHGAAVTTHQIAHAAGIGEGTIFRAFKDKEELLDACVHEALKPDDALAAIAEIPLDQPLASRLVEALREERFLILTHPEVTQAMVLRAQDPATYLAAMTKRWAAVN